MKKFSRWVDKFCYNHPNFGINNLMMFVVVGNVLSKDASDTLYSGMDPDTQVGAALGSSKHTNDVSVTPVSSVKNSDGEHYDSQDFGKYGQTEYTGDIYVQNSNGSFSKITMDDAKNREKAAE